MLCFFFDFSSESRYGFGKYEQWTLLVNGEPFYIKGAGGEKHLDILLECGGNTIRMWGENAQEALDLAENKRLSY